MIYQGTCPTCLKPFTGIQPHKKFCSYHCNDEYHRLTTATQTMIAKMDEEEKATRIRLLKFKQEQNK